MSDFENEERRVYRSEGILTYVITPSH